MLKRTLQILVVLVVLIAALVAFALATRKEYQPEDWGSFNVLAQKAPRPKVPFFNGKQLSDAEYLRWVNYGQEWFRNETFGNERLWTDVVGLFRATIDVPDGSGGYTQDDFLKYFLESIDDLDGVRGNLYTGNGQGYTSDLVVTLPPGSMLDRTFPLPEKLHTGLDVEAGSPWPLGIVPKQVPEEDKGLPYLIDPAPYANGPKGIGPMPSPAKYRVGLSCALCHVSLDVDWDGKADLKWVETDKPTPGSPYKPEHAWAIGNQDISLGHIFAMSANTIAGFAETGPAGTALIHHDMPVGTTLDDAITWAKYVKDNYAEHPDEVKREVDRGLLLFPRGFADDTPDGLHDPLQFPSLFTNWDWPFNYDGVMLNASDRNNNVWTNGLDISQLVALCSDRGGKTAKLVFWEKKGMYSAITAADYADIVVCNSPAARFDPSQREKLRNQILGLANGVPGMLRADSEALIKGVPGAIPGDIFNSPENANRIRSPSDFGEDGAKRGPMVGLLGTRVVTTPAIRNQYKVDDLEREYGIKGDEFVTEAVSMMLDWVEPPPNLSPLLANARSAGLVDKGYQVFRDEGCANCHAGPFFTNNLIIPLDKIGTDSARATATKPLEEFLAPEYDPRTGLAVSGGLWGFIRNLFASRKAGYKVVTLRYLWGSAPYLHDGGVGITLSPDATPAGDDLTALLGRPEKDKVYGIAQILQARDARPDLYLRANAALSLQGLLLKPERDKVIAANRASVYPIPGSRDTIPISAIHIQGIGHDYYVNDQPGGGRIAALVAFLLALDDDPGR